MGRGHAACFGRVCESSRAADLGREPCAVIASTYRLVNTEGTIVRIPQNLNAITLRSQSQAADGSYVWNHVSFTPVSPAQFPDEKTLTKSAQAIASETDALTKAPIAEDFSGPVLFEQEAAAQMMASVLSDAIRLHRNH